MTYKPNRHTVDMRLNIFTIDLTERASTMGNPFVLEGPVSPYIFAINGVLKSKGKVGMYIIDNE
ncbi:MAG: hypothetical protein AB7V56_13785 [Candidatus Nitrosocosmicus sp.]